MNGEQAIEQPASAKPSQQPVANSQAFGIADNGQEIIQQPTGQTDELFLTDAPERRLDDDLFATAKQNDILSAWEKLALSTFPKEGTRQRSNTLQPNDIPEIPKNPEPNKKPDQKPEALKELIAKLTEEVQRLKTSNQRLISLIERQQQAGEIARHTSTNQSQTIEKLEKEHQQQQKEDTIRDRDIIFSRHALQRSAA